MTTSHHHRTTGRPLLRLLNESDSLVALTELLHRAYAPLGAAGLNYTAVDQSVDVTRERIRGRACAVAISNGRIVGTVTVHGTQANSTCVWLQRDGVAALNQFAVEPTLQHTGIGTELLNWAEQWALRRRYAELALDTAEPATHLVDYYIRRGYRRVDSVQWEGKVYRSVVLSKRLGG